MNNIYLVSGLGADERVFNFLTLPEKYNINHIKWITPYKNESISNYASRLSDQIQTENNIIIGLSFGGLVALELSKHKKFNKIILISSIKNTKELPWFYRIIGKLKLINLIHASFFTRYTPLVSYLFGVQNKKEKDFLRIIIKDTDPVFEKWAIN